MKTRSSSVPKILCIGMFFLPQGKITELHDKVSSRVYGEKYTRANSKKSLFFNLDSQKDRPHISHERKQKSFEKHAQSSPNSRIKKIQEVRIRQSKDIFKHNNSRQSIVSSNEKSLARQERSHELLERASLLLKKEKENTTNIARRTRDISGKIKIKFKSAINKCERSHNRKSSIFK